MIRYILSVLKKILLFTLSQIDHLLKQPETLETRVYLLSLTFKEEFLPEKYLNINRFGKIETNMPLDESSKKFWEYVQSYSSTYVKDACVEKMTLEEYKREFSDLLK